MSFVGEMIDYKWKNIRNVSKKIVSFSKFGCFSIIPQKPLNTQIYFRLPGAQWAEAAFNKISGSKNKTYPGLISMLLGFQKCIA